MNTTLGSAIAADAAPIPPSLVASTKPPTATITRWLFVVLAVVLFSGSLFGYDQGVISGALAGIKASFSLSPLMIQVVTSWVTLGALLGSLAGGELADRIGRKRSVLTAGVLFTLGAAVQYFTPDTAVLVVGRLIIGAGVGVAAVAAPLYAAELAPASMRGRFVSGYQLAITVGIFLAYLVNGKLAADADWRLMLGAAAVPGLALVLVALLAPESPRWLLMKGRRPEAEAELRKIEPDKDTKTELDTIETALRTKPKKASWAEIFRPEWRRPLMIAVGLAVFQQITGINAIIYYANQIFESAGFDTVASRSDVTTWAVGAVNVLATLIAIAFIDRIGRRKLLLTGLFGMGISLTVVGAAFRFIEPATKAVETAALMSPSVAGIITVVALVGFIICFAFSLGPVVWTVINEVFPAHIRSRGVAFATAINWGSAWLVSQSFLSVVGLMGSSSTFWLLAAFCVLGFIWIYYQVPETKGQTLEQIEQMWKEKAS